MTTGDWFQSHRVQPTVGDRYQALVCPEHGAPVLDDNAHVHSEHGRLYGMCCFREAVGYAEETYRLEENRISERLRRYFGS